jgi:16S rRNA (guanine(527)-N(7))-methyltransferase RsmG
VFRDLLLARASPFCQLSSQQVDQLQDHYELMLRWNKTVNLTRIQRIEQVVDRHYGESLFLGSLLPPGELRVADVGSGAGFPGFPIAVLRPESSVTLIESHQRKAVFLKEASRGLCNIRVAPKRAEDLGEVFDWVVSRAVRWYEVEATAFRLASNVALLNQDALGLDGQISSIPWDPARRAVLFHVEHRFT